jgi:hypothetical protein
MSSFPNFSNIAGYVVDEINRRKGNTLEVSKLNCWARVVSGVDNGLILVSNPNIPLFRAAGQEIESLYGSSQTSGTIGKTWDNKPVNTGPDPQIGLPRTVISSFEVDEGGGNISRKASFTITAYTKTQLDEVTKYFLEPGFTVFLEWGWNTRGGVTPLKKIDVNYVTKATSAKELKKARESSGGHYECYLGFITGGGISFNGSVWEVSVNLTGFTELPAYLNVTDTIKRKDKDGNVIEEKVGGQKYRTITLEKDLGKKRFKEMFNELPSIRRITEVQTFLNDALIANPLNFVNFDEKIKKELNDRSDGFSVFGFTFKRAETQSTKIPTGTNIVGDEKFIRFGVLMDIINKFGSVNGYEVGKNIVNVKINTKNTPISAFENIFSTEKTKLIIPNAKTPKFDIAEAKVSGSLSTSDETVDYSFKSADTKSDTLTIQFPQPTPIVGGKVNGVNLFYSADTDIVSFNVSEKRWGYLDDLYVNFDFAASIIDTPKLSLIDALYQILNGMSSAVNGLWDFQVQEVASATDNGVMELRVVDMNLMGTPTNTELTTFDLYGVNSIFIDSSFSMDIGGAMMNQIIGKRLSTESNDSNPTTQGKLFAIGLEDKVLNKVQLEREGVVTDSTELNPTEVEEEQLKNLEDFLKSVGVYPKPTIKSGVLTNGDELKAGIDENVYFISYDDKKLFNEYKGEADAKSDDGVSILLPIRFSFTIHGISGIKRGDKFTVNGLPDKYNKENGFFQVLSVKHVVENMIWKTTVEGGFRQNRK